MVLALCHFLNGIRYYFLLIFIIHLKIIDEFTSKTTKGTMIAYYTTTMEAAIDFILREDYKKSNVNEINTNTLEIENE